MENSLAKCATMAVVMRDGESPRRAEGAKLEPGACIRIGDCKLQISSAIGEGTFGVVWGARCRRGNKVAVKEICCRSQAAVDEATKEGQILRALECTGASTTGRIPSFVACSTDNAGLPEWRYRLVMTHIAGDSLNRFLERRASSASWASKPLKQRFLDACNYARELLAQLAPTFARVSTVAYHRDVNPRNILVDEKDGNIFYGLIDFGLAVDTARWRLGAELTAAGDPVVGSWQILGVGGDCRYWPVSAWLMLEQGPKALVARPQLCVEYKTQLDLHALGITALQVLADLCMPREAAADSQSCVDDPDVLPEQLSNLLSAWRKYWDHAVRYWTRLFGAYCKGEHHRRDLAVVKAVYRAAEVHRQIGEDLRALRSALREACEAVVDEDGTLPADGVSLVEAQPLFSALLAMISSGEDSARCSWRRVELLVNDDDTQSLRRQQRGLPMKQQPLLPASKCTSIESATTTASNSQASPASISPASLAPLS